MRELYADNRADVREVQEYLRRLAVAYPRIPLLTVDGIFGPRTAEAVRVFQELFDLPVTGEVNRATWERLVEEYRRLTSAETPPVALQPFPTGDVAIGAGDTGPLVALVQSMLNTVALVYDTLPTVDVTGRYGGETEAAVASMQQRFGLEPTGRVDRATWDLLAATYNAYVGR